MFTHTNVFTVILLMNASLGIPTSVGAAIVTSTCAKATLLAHKTKRRKRRQPGKPLRRIRRDSQFPLLWTDEHVPTPGSIFNQRNERASLLGGMAHQRRHGWLTRHGGR